MNLQQFQQEHPDLWPAVQEWIRGGWGVNDDVEITALMVAAALEKEAITQDTCVAAGDSDASYPIRLRQLAGQLAKAASVRLEPSDTVKPKPQSLKDLTDVQFRRTVVCSAAPCSGCDKEISKGTECIVRQWQTPSMPGPAFWYAHLGCAHKWEDCPDEFKRDYIG